METGQSNGPWIKRAAVEKIYLLTWDDCLVRFPWRLFKIIRAKPLSQAVKWFTVSQLLWEDNHFTKSVALILDFFNFYAFLQGAIWNLGRFNNPNHSNVHAVFTAPEFSHEWTEISNLTDPTARNVHSPTYLRRHYANKPLAVCEQMWQITPLHGYKMVI